jgi:hypothetical protein
VKGTSRPGPEMSHLINMPETGFFKRLRLPGNVANVFER